MFRYLCIFFCLILVTACEQSPLEKTQPQEKPALKTSIFLKDPVEVNLVETASEALIYWQKQAQQNPTLVLISNNPFLQPIPEKYREQAIQLATHGNAEQIRQKAVDLTASPILLHDMALSAALSANLFSEVIWFIPTSNQNSELNLEEFKNQLLVSGIASPEEASSFVAENNVFSGHLRQTPFKAVSQGAPLAVTSPTMVHIDLSYFQPLYRNEVKTPLYPLLAEQLKKFQTMNIPVTAETVTLSTSNLDGSIPLTVRFIGHDLKILINDPALMTAQLPEFWFHRQQSLFLPNFFKNDDALEHLLAMEKMAPNDASVQFALYEIQRELKNGDEALLYLEKAVELDAGYATEYQNLSHVAITKGQSLAALKLLNKAATHYPANPLIKLAVADIQLSLGHREKALEILNGLSALTWSEIYDSEMPEHLKKMISAANQLPDSKSD